MKIVIAGCGKIGKNLVESLAAEHHEITVVDDNPVTITSVAENYDCLAVCANCAHYSTLKDINAGDCDLFIATTGDDEVNMLACFLAKKMGAAHTVARIRNQEYSADSLGFIKDSLNLSMIINPDYLTAKRIRNMLKLPAAVKTESFTRGRFEMAELIVKEDSEMIGQTMIGLRNQNKFPFLVCSVLRDKDVFIPSGSFTLEAGDKVGIIATPDNIQKFLKSFEMEQKGAKNVMILGASRIAKYLAKSLLDLGSSVKVIEKDEKRCTDFVETLPSSVNVICADGTDQELLLQEGLEKSDAFVALTGMDEENISISFFAATKGVPTVVTKVNQNEHTDIMDKLGLERSISPKNICADIIIQYARALSNSMGSSVETLYHLMDGTVEAVEFKVSDNFDALDTPIKDIKLKSDILIAGIIRGNMSIIPGGLDEIKAGDRVIVISAGRNLSDLSEILK